MKHLKTIAWGIAIVAALAFAVHQYVKYRIAPSIDAFEMPLTDLQGTPVKLSEFQGQPVFLNFYGTWCRDCIEEMPSIERAQQQLGAEGMAFILLSEESLPKVRSFSQRYSNKLHFFSLQNKTFAEYGIHTYPTTYILNSKGEIVLKKTGGKDWGSPAMVDKIREAAGMN